MTHLATLKSKTKKKKKIVSRVQLLKCGVVDLKYFYNKNSEPISVQLMFCQDNFQYKNSKSNPSFVSEPNYYEVLYGFFERK